MSETRQVIDRHFVAPLTDDEYLDLKVRVAKAGMKVKEWVSQAILEKLNEKEKD